MVPVQGVPVVQVDWNVAAVKVVHTEAVVHTDAVVNTGEVEAPNAVVVAVQTGLEGGGVWNSGIWRSGGE